MVMIANKIKQEIGFQKQGSAVGLQKVVSLTGIFPIYNF